MQLAAPNRARCQRRLAFLRIAEVFALDIAFYRTRRAAACLVSREGLPGPPARQKGWGHPSSLILDEAIKYALSLNLLDAFTIGAESKSEQDNLIQRVAAA